MKDNFRKIVYMLVSVFAFLFAASGVVYAETKEGTINIGEGYQTGAFIITWDNEEVKGTVTITAPDGTVYSAKKTPDYVSEDFGMATVGVPKVPAGEWKVKVSGVNLGTIHVEFGRLPGAMNIDSFTVAASGAKGTASLSVSDSEPEVQIEIFADTDTTGFDGERVFSQYGAPNGKFELDLSGLPSGEYHFYVVLTKDGTWSREYASEPYSYHSPTADKKIAAVGGNYNGGYYLRWEFDPDNSRNYLVRVWDEDMNLVASEELDDENFYYNDFDADQNKVYMAVTYSYGNCDYDLIEADKTAGVDGNVIFDIDDSITNRGFIEAEVTFNGNMQLICYLNGENKLEESKTGTYRIELVEGSNNVTFELTDDKGNMQDFVKEISLDTYPPQLSISNDINGTVTPDDHIYVSGYTETGAVLTINGEKVELENSFFNHKAGLTDGKNEIIVVARDKAGNESRYKASVERNDVKEKKENRGWLIAGIAGGVLLLLYIFMFIRAKRRDKK